MTTFFQTTLTWMYVVGLVVTLIASAVMDVCVRRVLSCRDIKRVLCRQSWCARVVVFVCVLEMVVYGSTKPRAAAVGNATMTSTTPTLVMAATGVVASADGDQDLASSVSESDIARGCQRLSVSTNVGYSYAMPTNGILHGHWRERGAYEDVVRIDFGDWGFLHGSNEVRRLWAFSWGMARSVLRDAACEIAPVGSPMSAIPYMSRLWTAQTSNDTQLVTWEKFVFGRVPLSSAESAESAGFDVVNAQIELFCNGDFILRSNEVATAFRNIDPNDWDGDGWTNDVDLDPRVWTGGDFGLSQPLPDGANESAYCWIDVRTPYNAVVRFSGDGASDLPDPTFTTRAGETNRVTLLVGKRYAVESVQPVSVVGKSASEIMVDGDGTTALTVVYPVTVEAADGDNGGFAMRVSPSNLGGEFDWTRHCCPITGFGLRFWYACTAGCDCTGCAAGGFYSYEGYSLVCGGGACGCPMREEDARYATCVDDGPHAASVSVSFSSPAVVFEDAYTNRPGEVVERRSTRTTLVCIAHGGEQGVSAKFSLDGGGRLLRVRGGELPVSKFVPPQQKLEFEVEYEGLVTSDERDDIVATAVMTGYGDSLTPSSVEARLTSAKVELRAVYDAPENDNPTRHLYGVGELVELRHWPQSADVAWVVGEDDAGSSLLPGDDCDGVLRLHYRGEYAVDLRARCGGVEYSPSLSLVEPQEVLCREVEWDGGCLPRGLSGGFGMYQTLHVTPMYVSFCGIDMAEIPCDSVVPPSGYYASTNFAGSLSHTSAVGAGAWHHVGVGNRWCVDHAASGARTPPWSDGVMVWKIPIQWFQRLDSSLSWLNGMTFSDGKLVGGSDSAYMQAFEMSGSGTVKVTKHGHWISRSTNDVIRLDGRQVHGGVH